MDIAQLSMVSAQANVMTQVGTSVLSMQLDQVDQAGAGLIKMMDENAKAMQLSVQPHLGSKFDMSV